jgi:hypothetical protein
MCFQATCARFSSGSRNGDDAHGIQFDGSSSERHHGPYTPLRDRRFAGTADGTGNGSSTCPRHDQRWPRISFSSDGERGQQFGCHSFHGGPGHRTVGRHQGKPEPGWIAITLRAIGQMIGQPNAQPGDSKKSWINLAWQSDPRTGTPRAWVNLEPTDRDMAAWKQGQVKHHKGSA